MVRSLAESEPSQQSICEMWSLSKQTVNSIIYSMKRKGLVYLERIPHTRNKKIIRLTQTEGNMETSSPSMSMLLSSMQLIN